jgi:hypothetical protein
MKTMKTIFLLVTILLFTSCKILRFPGRVKVDNEISGVCSSKKDPCKQDNIFIIMHGIGSQKSDYSESIINRLNNYTYGKNNYKYEIEVLENSEFNKKDNNSLKEICKEYNNDKEIEVLKIKAISLDKSKSYTNTFYSINWSVVLDESKHNLVETEFGNSPHYWGINKILKKMLVMEKFSDAFAGSQPDLTKKFYKTILEIVKDGDILDNKTSALNVITGSFGTQLFLGAINELQKKDKSKIYQSLLKENNYISSHNINISDNKFMISKDLKLKIYALTNQVNLMPNNVNQWYSGISDSTGDTSRLNFSSVQIMAFRNPNDLLCYYLPDSVGKSFFPDKI